MIFCWDGGARQPEKYQKINYIRNFFYNSVRNNVLTLSLVHFSRNLFFFFFFFFLMENSWKNRKFLFQKDITVWQNMMSPIFSIKKNLQPLPHVGIESGIPLNFSSCGLFTSFSTSLLTSNWEVLHNILWQKLKIPAGKASVPRF